MQTEQVALIPNNRQINNIIVFECIKNILG